MEDNAKIGSLTDLRDAIHQLEIEQDKDGRLLKQQFEITYESIKPVNLIKSTFKDVVSSDDLKNDFLNTGVGFAAGFVSKMLFVGFSKSPIRKLIGTALMFGVTNLVAKRGDFISKVSRKLLKSVHERIAHAAQKPASGIDGEAY